MDIICELFYVFVFIRSKLLTITEMVHLYVFVSNNCLANELNLQYKNKLFIIL
jgi:hypothetical protein